MGRPRLPGGRGDVQRPAYNVRREIRELAYFRDTSKLAATSSFVGPKSQLFFTLLVDETRLRSSPSRRVSTTSDHSDEPTPDLRLNKSKTAEIGLLHGDKHGR